MRQVTRTYYNGSTAAIIVYDVTSIESLNKAKEWFESIKDFIPADCFVCLVGNKVDLVDQIEVQTR